MLNKSKQVFCFESYSEFISLDPLSGTQSKSGLPAAAFQLKSNNRALSGTCLWEVPVLGKDYRLALGLLTFVASTVPGNGREKNKCFLTSMSSLRFSQQK